MARIITKGIKTIEHTCMLEKLLICTLNQIYFIQKQARKTIIEFEHKYMFHISNMNMDVYLNKEINNCLDSSDPGTTTTTYTLG